MGFLASRAAAEARAVYDEVVVDELIEPQWSAMAYRGVRRARKFFCSNGHHADTNTSTPYAETILGGDAMLIATSLCTRILNPARLDLSKPTHLEGLASARRMNPNLVVPTALAEQPTAQAAA
jgi:hypothetical protein